MKGLKASKAVLYLAAVTLLMLAVGTTAKGNNSSFLSAPTAAHLQSAGLHYVSLADKKSVRAEPAGDFALILLKGCPKLMYTATLRIGHQELDAIIDTGSSNLVLMGAKCLGCSDTPRYHPGSSAVDLSMKETAAYSNLYHPVGAYGEIYLDDVSVPDMIVPNVTGPIKLALMSASLSGLSSQPVLSCAEANKIARLQPDLPAIAGMLGLNIGQSMGSFMFKHGLEDLAEASFILALVKAGMHGIFGMHLCNVGGFLWLGGYDRNHVAARKVPEFVPMIHTWSPLEGHPYKVQIDGISIAGQEVSTKTVTSRSAVVDTGNRFLNLPSVAFNSLNKSVSAALASAKDRDYNWSHPVDLPNCMLGLPQDREELDSLLPDLTLRLAAEGNKTVSLNMRASQSYMVAYLNGDQSMWCFEVNDAEESMGNIGIPVLRNFVTVFDLENDMIGFALPVASKCSRAPAPPKPQPPPPPPPPPPPAIPWWQVFLYVLAACASALSLAYAAFAFIGRRRARNARFEQRNSQQGAALLTPTDREGAEV